MFIVLNAKWLPSYFRTMWKKCCFSGNGEYIVAGTARHHTLYIWDKASGNLVKILSGQKEKCCWMLW